MSASTASSSKIKIYWDHFFSAETGTYEKSTWLDLFLAEFLVQLKEGVNPQDIVTFCPVSGVVTLVGCELLCGIHQVTSSINTQYTPPIGYINNLTYNMELFQSTLTDTDNKEIVKVDDGKPTSGPFAGKSCQSTIQPLLKYLLKGPAWRCLALLQVMGVEGLSCSRQLCAVLIWLYGELSGASTSAHGLNPHLPCLKEKLAVQDLFSSKIWTKRKLSSVGSQGYKNNMSGFDNSVLQFSNSKTKKKTAYRSESKPRKLNVDYNTSESENPSGGIELLELSRPLAIKPKNHDDFHYFTSAARSDGEYSRHDSFQGSDHACKPKPKADDHITDKHREILDSEITPFEFSLLVINLLQELCKAETSTSISGSEGLQISVQCINFSLRYLCSLQFGSLPVSSFNYNSEELAHLKAVLTELLIVSLDKVLVRPDLSIKVTNNGILPMLLRLLEDIIYKLPIQIQMREQRQSESSDAGNSLNSNTPDKNEAEYLTTLLFGVTYSITAFFYCLLIQSRSLQKLFNFTEQFMLFGDCQKGTLLRQSIALLIRIPGVDQQLLITLIKKLVESISRLINGMKRVKSEVVHSSACPRNRHKVCRARVAAGMHHHHHILGDATAELGMGPMCCVSILYGTLTSLLIDDSIAAQPLLRTKILRSMLQCGSCCCFPPGYLFENLVRITLTHRGVSSLCLSVLEHTIYGELGAGILKARTMDKLPCTVCEQYREKQTAVPKQNVDLHDEANCTDSVRRYCIQSVHLDSKSVWSFLVHYNSLLQLDNDNHILHSTMGHLLRVTPKCRLEMKHELLFAVIYPTFIVAKNRYLIKNDDAAYFLTISCLNIFATLLNTISFAEEFIQKEGLKYVLELVSLPQFSKQCCAILEIAIIVDIWKLKKDSTQTRTRNNDVTEMLTLSSLSMLMKTLNSVTEKCYKLCRVKLNADDFKRLSNVSKERFHLQVYLKYDESDILVIRSTSKSNVLSMKPTSPIDIRTGSSSYSTLEEAKEEHLANYLELLKNVWTFWKTCAGLCLYSPDFRKFIVQQPIFLDTFKLLKLVFHYICYSPTSVMESKVLIRILEALLTIQFAVSDVTMDKSKSITMDILRDAFLSEEIMSVDHASLKSICEMLIRVSTTSASEEQVMPPLNKAKLPPLLCTSVSSDCEESSTSEEDANANADGLAGPYMSEGSDYSYYTADEGYEGDVEVGRADIMGGKDFLGTQSNQFFENSPTTDTNYANQPGTSRTLTEANVLECNEYTKTGSVTHPQLCVMVVDILMQLIEKFLLSSKSSMAEGVEGTNGKAVGKIGVALARTCCARLSSAWARPHRFLAAGMSAAHDTFTIIERLLTGTAYNLLTHCSHELEDLQRSILSLVHVLACQSILPSELSSYLKLFAASAPPLAILLEALSKLVDQVQQNMPDFILCFPVDKYSNAELITKLSVLDDVQTNINSVSSQSPQAENVARKYYQSHSKAGIKSPWSCAGVRAGIEGASWGVWQQGFSVSLWLRIQDGAPPTPSSSEPQEDTQSSSDSMSEWGIISDNWHEQVDAREQTDSETSKHSSGPRKKKTGARMGSGGGSAAALHMLSVGHEGLVLESWLDTNSGNITFKLSKPENLNNKIVGEITIDSNVQPHQWNFVAFNVKDIVLKRKIHIQITLFVNGVECDTATLPVQGILVRKVLPTSLLLGHAVSQNNTLIPNPNGVWYFSGLSLFRLPVLNKYNVLYTMAHGPNTTIINSCQVKYQSPNFASLLSANVLASHIDWDQVYEMSSTNLRDLQDNLLLTYSAQTPTIMNLYHQTISLPTVFPGRVGVGVGTSMGTMGGVAGGAGGAAAGIPETLCATWCGTAAPGRHRGLAPAAFMLGGPHTFMYFFARIVELDGTGEEQAKALSMLLRLCYSDNRLYSVFYEDDCLSMIHIVLASSKCLITHHILKALLDAACSTPILVSSNSRFHILTRCDAIVVEPNFLVAIIRAWRDLERPQNKSKRSSGTDANGNPNVQYPPSVWMYERSDSVSDLSGGLMGTLFLCMHVMLRDDHPHRTFNSYQMNRVNIIDHLLLFCKERFLNSEFGLLSDSISCSLVELIRALMGAPPLLCHLALLTDFLVLMHQASETFVTHSRSNFYFLLTSLTQSSSNAELSNINMHIPFPGKKKSHRKSGRLKKRSVPGPNSKPDTENLGIVMRDLHTRNSSYNSLHLRLIDNDNCNENRLNIMKEMNRNIDISSSSSFGANKDGYNLQRTGTDISNTEDSLIESHSTDNCKYRRQMKLNSTQKGRRRRRSRRSSGSNSPSIYESTNNMIDNKEEELDQIIQEMFPEQQTLASEYVVIDSDEVDKNTIQMFSSGIFHQTRVRAGAAPGWTACEGLLLLLRDIVYVMPDTTLSQLLGVVVQSETLLVLGNHAEASVRTGVVRVVAALTQRAAHEELRRLDAAHYFYHLANQISLYPASHDLVSACASLVTGFDTPLEDQLEDIIWYDIPDKAILRAPPILALLPCSLQDIPLAHNITLFIKKIIDKGAIKILQDIGLTEVVVRCLRTIGAVSDSTFEGRELILEDLRSLLNRLVLKAMKQQQNLQTIMDMHHQLTYMELMEQSQTHTESLSCHVLAEVRHAQCHLYQTQLDFLEEKLSHAYCSTNKTSNYFATVLSSAVVSMAPSSDGSSGMSSSSQNISRSDLASRHRATLVKAVHFIITRDSQHLITDAEISLVERLFVILINAVTGSSPGIKPKWWASVSGGDWHTPLNDIFQWLLSPLTYSEILKAFALRIIYESPAAVQQILTPNDPTGQRKLAVYLLSVLKLLHASPVPLVETTITDWARNWALQMQAQLADRVDSNTLADEARHFAVEDAERAKKILTQQLGNINKSVFNKDWLSSKLTETAMSITRQIVDVQNAERKAFMDHLRRVQSETVTCTQKWQKLIDTHTHEHSLWHNAETYPKSWELDPTEGPGRIRVRLRRSHLKIGEKFLKDDFKYKLDSIKKPSPLSFLFTSPQSVMHNGLLERLHMNESVNHMARVTYVTVTSDQPGELLLSDRCIHFVPENLESDDEDICPGTIASALSWSLERVVSVATRRWCLRERAVELFLNSGHAHLVAFQNTDEMNAFLKALNATHLPARSETETLTEATNLWRNGTLTNWEYLMRLNGWGGRSYNDLMQYPVLPFVLADYTSTVLHLTNPTSYRDLRKPMAVQDRKNETHYINNYNYLKQARREGSQLITGVNKEPYHYGSHYSNSGTVLHFLVRLPPFTKLFLSYQDNNFDIPDRTFHSLQTTWRLTSCDSTTDVKELIPEFYYLPEFLMNSEGLQLGVRQCGIAVDDVELPPWAPSYRLYCLIHRQALESSLVTETLPAWIDLVFGYKQTGQAAVDAVNVFHPATYYGFDPSSITDEVERAAWETMVRTYGQTPRQLLKQAHPHAATDLYHAPEDAIPVSVYVVGARWGRYCGSPASPPAVLVVSRRGAATGCPAARLAALPEPRAVAATPHTTLVIALHQHRHRVHLPLGWQPTCLALLTWGHSDRMVRLKTRKELPPDILMQVPAIDEITTAATSCLSPAGTVWIGHASGRILVLRPRAPAFAPHATPYVSSHTMSHVTSHAAFRTRPAELRAHTQPIVSMCVCDAFGVAASASKDGLIVLWDLNKLSYVRTIPNKGCLNVSQICISETLCDIVTVHHLTYKTSQPNIQTNFKHEDSKSDSSKTYRTTELETGNQSRYKSLLRVHTVNGSYVGNVKVLEKVMCVCYSNAPEGVSVNCIAAGLDTGAVRLYSSWDLRPVTYIASPTHTQSLVSITYSMDSQHLFAVTSDGTVLVWESGGGSTKSGNVRILTAQTILHKLL